MSFPNAALFPYTAEVSAQGNLVLGGCDVVELAAEFEPMPVEAQRSLMASAKDLEPIFSTAQA